VISAFGGSLQEAIGNPPLHNGSWLVVLILGVIAEHVRQHRGVKDAARRRDERAEILVASDPPDCAPLTSHRCLPSRLVPFSW
jgi:hypothetical protein